MIFVSCGGGKDTDGENGSPSNDNQKPQDAVKYTRDGDYIFFGEYPQTLKADDVTITDVRDERGYCLGSDGSYYAEVYANPAGSDYKFSTGEVVSAGNVYYLFD